MKKTTLILTVILILVLSGCAAQHTRDAAAGIITTVPREPIDVIASPESIKPEECSDTPEPIGTDDSTSEAADDKSSETADPLEIQPEPPAPTQTTTPKTESPPTESSTPPSQHIQSSTPPPAPIQSEAPYSPPPSAAAPDETPESMPSPSAESSLPKTAYDAPYDTAVIIADARAYGESIGMTWSPTLTPDNCSWEAPGATSATLSGERLKTAIESGIRRVKKLQQDNEYQPGSFTSNFISNRSGMANTRFTG